MRHCVSSSALVLVALALPASPAMPAQEREAGQVQLPLEAYERLQASASRTGYALGSANVMVGVALSDQRFTGSVRVRLSVDVLQDDWVLVPVLPPGTAIESAAVGGKPVPLTATAEGLAWIGRGSGSYTMDLAYRVDATRSESGFNLPVPLPRASGIQISATLPGANLDVAVIPAVDTKISSTGNATQVTATVPASNGVQISWRLPSRQRYSVSRARYRGELAGDAVVWSGEVGVELFGDGTTLVPLFPRTITLTDLSVDGSDSPIVAEGGRLATLVRGRGPHRIVLGFEVPVLRQDGPPRVDLEIPPIPVSRFDLTLPGSKALTVTPVSHVSSRTSGPSTVATVYVPMTDRVSFAWSEAVPAELAEFRASATTYHLVHVEEGVLYVRAVVDYEVSRGATSLIELTVPPDVQIERVDDGSHVVADWRMTRTQEGGPGVVSVFLDRELRGRLQFEILYDRPLSGGGGAKGIEVPLARAVGAQRQRGMVALLANADVTLNPTEEGVATRVGENQLPESVRETVDLIIAHTYKYADELPKLVVEPATPVREQGKFDAQVDTLISLGDVSLTGASSVEIHVKSGGITELHLAIPQAVNVLNVTAPSLRTHRVDSDGDGRLIDLEFTQEMEGSFRIDLTYERILAGSDSQVQAPTPAVRGAEVEQGRIAVEALSALEVRPAVVEHLSPLDVNELPQQLLLRTANPILLAYKYVQAAPPQALTLDVARHRVLGVQEAAIDRADYRTLFTSDGLSVTTARFVVRNSRKQFLRVRLPKASEVWAVFVDGKPEKPALAESGPQDGWSVLIKILNSTEGFPVELICAVSGPGLGRRGKIEGALPRPDILVTRSHWDVYLPADVRYEAPTTNMNLLEAGGPVSRADMDAEAAQMRNAAVARQGAQPLRIMVPASGLHYAFEKLYANQEGQEAWFSAPYRRP